MTKTEAESITYTFRLTTWIKIKMLSSTLMNCYLHKILIVTGLVVLAITHNACTKSSGDKPANDTTFNGSYFDITFNGHSYHSRDTKVGGAHLVDIGLSIRYIDSYQTRTEIFLTADQNSKLYGLQNVTFNMIGNIDYPGAYSFVPYNNGQYANIGSTTSSIQQFDSSYAYFDTANYIFVTYSDASYIAGTFNTSLFSSVTGVVPATGSFKIYR